jgi:hypothetical protein
VKRLDQIDGYRDMVRTSIREGKCFPLLPRHEVLLRVPGGDGRHFVAAFRRAWGRVPLWARRRRLRHWKGVKFIPSAHLGHVDHPQPSPYFDLSYDSLGGSPTAYAQVKCPGHHLHFTAPAVAAMPDEVLQDLIAHALAHVLQDAAGIRCIEYSAMAGRSTLIRTGPSSAGTTRSRKTPT